MTKIYVPDPYRLAVEIVHQPILMLAEEIQLYQIFLLLVADITTLVPFPVGCGYNAPYPSTLGGGNNAPVPSPYDGGNNCTIPVSF